MKTLFIILISLCSLGSQAQKIDSVRVFNPANGHALKTITHPEKFEQALDSLSSKLKTKEFIIVKYFNDGKAVQCRFRKEEEYKEII